MTYDIVNIVNISVDTAIPNPINCGEVEIEGSKDTQHSGTSEHYMEMSNDVESIMEEYIHTSMGDGHPRDSTGNKEEYKRKRK